VNVPVEPTVPVSEREVNVATPFESVIAVVFDAVAEPDVVVNAAVTVTPDFEAALPSASTIWTTGACDTQPTPFE